MAEVEEMVRLSVRVPVETRDELAKLSEMSGLKMSAFLATSLVIGSRQLIRQTNPEHFVTPRLMRAILETMGFDVEQVAAAVGKGIDELLAEINQGDESAVEVRKIA